MPYTECPRSDELSCFITRPIRTEFGGRVRGGFDGGVEGAASPSRGRPQACMHAATALIDRIPLLHIGLLTVNKRTAIYIFGTKWNGRVFTTADMLEDVK